MGRPKKRQRAENEGNEEALIDDVPLDRVEPHPAQLGHIEEMFGCLQDVSRSVTTSSVFRPPGARPVYPALPRS